MIVSMLDANFRHWERDGSQKPEGFHNIHSMVLEGSVGGLHSFEHVQLHVVMTAPMVPAA